MTSRFINCHELFVKYGMYHEIFLKHLLTHMIHNKYEQIMHLLIGALWSCVYGSWIYNYLKNKWISPLTFWVRTSLRRGVLDTTLCDQVFQWLVASRRFSPGTPVSFNKTDRNEITAMLLKMALNTITITLY